MRTMYHAVTAPFSRITWQKIVGKLQDILKIYERLEASIILVGRANVTVTA